ncbi:uncharacterized protein LOC105390103 [Plutella xylostella]|nr:uncharacterized protein LOC105390103 [Plutella xylostella]
MLQHLLKSLSVIFIIINEVKTQRNDADSNEPKLGPRLAQPNVLGVILNKYRKTETSTEAYYELIRDDDKAPIREKRKTTTTTTEKVYQAYIDMTTERTGKVRRAMLSHLNGTVIIPIPYTDVIVEMQTLFFLAASIVFAMRCCCNRAQC